MGSIIGHRVDYNEVGVLRGQWHIPDKDWPKYPPTEANLNDTVISQLGKRHRKWTLMLMNDSRQQTEAAQHHLKELLEHEGNSKYSYNLDKVYKA